LEREGEAAEAAFLAAEHDSIERDDALAERVKPQ
jgi:hypothetical protein